MKLSKEDSCQKNTMHSLFNRICSENLSNLAFGSGKRSLKSSGRIEKNEFSFEALVFGALCLYPLRRGGVGRISGKGVSAAAHVCARSAVARCLVLSSATWRMRAVLLCSVLAVATCS